MAFPNIIEKIKDALVRIGVLEEDFPRVSRTANDALALARQRSPIPHNVEDNTYGLGTGTKYGHVKLSDATNSTSGISSGIAATPNAVNLVRQIAISASGDVSNCVLKSGSTMTGALKMPTPDAGTNDTTVATTAWVRREMLNIVYPVGSIYMSVNNVSPSIFLGGTWVQITGKFLIGADTTYTAGTTGGSATHNITKDELPAHNHTVTAKGAGRHSHTKGNMRIQGSITSTDEKEHLTLADEFTATGAMSISNKNADERGYMLDSALTIGGHRDTITVDTNLHSGSGWTGSTSEEPNHEHVLTCANTGSGSAMSIMPPYVSVYMWKRTK